MSNNLYDFSVIMAVKMATLRLPKHRILLQYASKYADLNGYLLKNLDSQVRLVLISRKVGFRPRYNSRRTEIRSFFYFL